MSYAKQMKQELAHARTVIVRAIRLTDAEHTAMMFNYGAEFAEHFCTHHLERPEFATTLLQCSGYGFWPWWEYIWRMDDAAQVKASDKIPLDDLHYRIIKDTLIGDPEIEKDLYHYIEHLL